MDITQFVAGSIGQWRSQRSAHHMVFSHFEAVRSEIDIVALTPDTPAVIELCQAYDIDPSQAVVPFQMSWEGDINAKTELSIICCIRLKTSTAQKYKICCY